MQHNHDLDAQSASLFEQMKKRPPMDVANLTMAEKVKTEREGYAKIISVAGFKNLPTTFITTASADPLEDEGRAYTQKLAEAGVQVEHKEFVGVMHGFYQMSPVFDKGRTALQDAAEALSKAFNG